MYWAFIVSVCLSSCMTELIWKVGRYTSAAPLVFDEIDNYVDGGLMANNPSEYGLMEIRNFHLQQNPKQKLPISLVVSVGAGVCPKMKLGNINAHEYLVGPRILKTLSTFGNLGQLLSNAVSVNVLLKELSEDLSNMHTYI